MKTVKVVIHFFQSFFYFYIQLIFNKKIDVLFYYPQHFNLNSSQVRSLQIMIDACNDNKLSFLVIEEPDFNFKHPRNKTAIKFDFFYIIISVFRKFYSNVSCVYEKDRRIGAILSFMFIKKTKVKNIITISQSMQSLFSVVYPKANLYDYQHGIISKIYDGYSVHNKIASTILDNNVKLLLHGSFIKEKLMNCNGGEYFNENALVIGAPYKKYDKPKKSFDGNILFSLQFSNSHSKETNQLLFDQTISFFKKINSDFSDVKIYLKHHPRFNNCIDVSSFYDYPFVKDSPLDVSDCFKLCSLHITEYSTMVFDGITFGVPTLFTNFCNEFDLFKEEYEFPYSDINIIDGLINLSDENFYIEVCKNQLNATDKFYQPFDENLFLKTILK